MAKTSNPSLFQGLNTEVIALPMSFLIVRDSGGHCTGATSLLHGRAEASTNLCN